MSGLLERSEEMKMWESIVQTKEYQKELENTLPQTIEIQAVVGVCGFGAGKTAKEKLWSASVRLTAWKEEQSGEIHQEELQLSVPADDRFLKYLQNSVKGDSVIRCNVRISKDRRFLLMTGPVQKGDDPGLKAILAEQVQEITIEADDFGIFTLERLSDRFETKVDWLGMKVVLSFKQDEEEAMKRFIETARVLMADQRGWGQRIRECAVNDLLDLANDWAAGEMDIEELERLEEEDERPVSREQFLERIELESIDIEEDGGFEFWFYDGDIFYGHSIHVTGNVEDGPDEAVMGG